MSVITAMKLSAALRRGASVADSDFDSVYPLAVQNVSGRYWSPISVARTGAAWFREAGCTAALDVGSGAGKFCIVSNLAASCAIQGVEQRGNLIEAAESAARAYQATTKFVHTTIEHIDPQVFDAFYFFNPFGENYYEGVERFDEEVELSHIRCMEDVGLAEAWLDRARIGTHVLTYHGFGGRVPDTYDLVKSIRRRGGALRMWRKRSSVRATGFRLEFDDLVLSSKQLERIWPRLTPLGQQQLRELMDRPLGSEAPAALVARERLTDD